MGRFWLGIGLMVMLLCLGLWVASETETVHAPVSRTLQEAAAKSLSGDLEKGVDLARKAQDYWEQCWHRTAAVADHTPMDEIDGLFAQMEVYAHAGEAAEFAAHCKRVSKLVEAIGEAHSLTWWNLL